MPDDVFLPGLDHRAPSVTLPNAPWDAVGEGIVLLRPSGTITFANQAACAQLGWAHDELLGQPFDMLLAESHRPALAATGAGRRHVVAQHRARGALPVELTLNASPADGLIVATIRDLSAERADRQAVDGAEHRRQQTAKLDELVDLAGTLAHEFNNALAVILSSVGFLAEAVPADSAAGQDVERIRAAAERGARLTRQLLGPTPTESGPVAPVDLGALLGHLAWIVERATGADLRVRRAADLPPVAVDVRELEQLVLALTLDHPTSPGEDREVVLETALADLTQADLAGHVGARPGPYVVLIVTTTRRSARGFGATLALTSAYNIVRRVGGVLEFDDTATGSSWVRVLLPTGGPVVPPPAAADRRYTILVVDDTAALLLLTARLLRKHGYAVLEASGGKEALQLARSNEIDLVLTDVVMPRMSGVELVDALHELPTPPVALFMSAYSDSMLTVAGDRDVPLLRKPFSEEQLLQQVAAQLPTTMPFGGD